MSHSRIQAPQLDNNTQQMHLVFLALGTNLGERVDNLQAALNLLRASVCLERVSSIYETAPVGYTDQPNFLNLACYGATSLTVEELLKQTQSIEHQLGRKPNFRNGPRLIDIDILFYDQLSVQQESLTVPHPRLHERAFVLAPLAEIAPDLRHPTLGKTIRELRTEISEEGILSISPGGLSTT